MPAQKTMSLATSSPQRDISGTDPCCTSKMTEYRKCNALESFYLAENVRFVVAFSFPPCASSIVENALRGVASDLDGNVAVGCWISALQPGFLSVRSADELPQPTFKVLSGTAAASLQHALDEDVSTEYLDDVAVSILKVHGESDDNCTGVIINANHAICDGREIVHQVGSFMRALSEQLLIPKTLQTPSTVGSDIGSVLQMPPQSYPNVLPLFDTEIDVKHLTFHDIAAIPVINSENQLTCIHREIPAHVMKEARIWAKEQARQEGTQQSATVTGLLLAAFSEALAKTFFFQRVGGAVHEDCGVSISTLVDMRPFLPDGVVCTQAISTVTVGNVHRRLECMNAGDAGRRLRLLKLAESLTDQVRRRIGNGEAHAQALSMANGTEFALQQATMELSNLGMFDVPAESKVIVGQRFDKYEGISVLAHSERGTGNFRLAASWGIGLNAEVIGDVSNAAIEILLEIAG